MDWQSWENEKKGLVMPFLWVPRSPIVIPELKRILFFHARYCWILKFKVIHILHILSLQSEIYEPQCRKPRGTNVVCRSTDLEALDLVYTLSSWLQMKINHEGKTHDESSLTLFLLLNESHGPVKSNFSTSSYWSRDANCDLWVSEVEFDTLGPFRYLAIDDTSGSLLMTPLSKPLVGSVQG